MEKEAERAWVCLSSKRGPTPTRAASPSRRAPLWNGQVEGRVASLLQIIDARVRVGVEEGRRRGGGGKER